METTVLTAVFTLLTVAFTFYTYTLKKKIQDLSEHITQKTASNVEVINSATHNFNSRVSLINVEWKNTAAVVSDLTEDVKAIKSTVLELWTHVEDLTNQHNAVCEQCNQMDKELSKCKTNCPCPAAKAKDSNSNTKGSTPTKNSSNSNTKGSHSNTKGSRMIQIPNSKNNAKK